MYKYILILCLLFFSCSKDENTIEEEIIIPIVKNDSTLLKENILGEWYNENDNTTVWIYEDLTLKYNSQGVNYTLEWEVENSNEFTIITTAKWEKGKYDSNNVNGYLHLWKPGGTSDYFDKIK